MMFLNYLIPVGIVVLIGLISAAVLTLAAKFMSVTVNEAVSQVYSVLPGANCGACGFAGCEEYARQLVDDKTVKANLCTPGGSEVSLKISTILGIDFESVAGKYAIVKCSGTLDKTDYIMDFRGLQSCSANKLFYRGRGSCFKACLGYGDCVLACNYDAISIVNGVAVVDKCKCVGCGLCANRCPNQLIEIIPSSSRVFVGCSSTDTGAYTRKVCKAGCIACKKCEKACEAGAITIANNLATIDPAKCTNCGACITQCPVSVILSTR
jgi:Na+-translocating ferredoxin:NAD+ oxidoreductase subunit B